MTGRRAGRKAGRRAGRMVRTVRWNRFPNAADLAQELASSVSENLCRVVQQRGEALLAVSGGSTPKLLFDRLSTEMVFWSQVTLTLVDERWSRDPKDRNETLVRQHLLRNAASAARFVPLYQESLSVEQAVAHLQASVEFGALGDRTPDLTILGMGTDGHTASLFPDAAEVEQALDPSNPNRWTSVTPGDAPHPRLSMTLSAVASSERTVLHIVGEEKCAVLQRALASVEENLLPVRRVADACPWFEVWWSPD